MYLCLCSVSLQREFPCAIANESQIECQEVHDFVLDTGRIVIINGIECVTLGHDFNGEVIEHPYYWNRLHFK